MGFFLFCVNYVWLLLLHDRSTCQMWPMSLGYYSVFAIQTYNVLYWFSLASWMLFAILAIFALCLSWCMNSLHMYIGHSLCTHWCWIMTKNVHQNLPIAHSIFTCIGSVKKMRLFQNAFLRRCTFIEFTYGNTSIIKPEKFYGKRRSRNSVV